MAKIRNKNGEARETPHGIAQADGVLEVPDDAVYGYTCQAGWEPSDKAATTAHNAGERAEAEAVKGSQPDPGPEPEVEPAPADA